MTDQFFETTRMEITPKTKFNILNDSRSIIEQLLNSLSATGID